MQIDFFEEFPTVENLEKLSLLESPCTVYLAAHSVDEFRQLTAPWREKAPHISWSFWPLLPDSYWISPFSFPSELRQLVEDLQRPHEEGLEILLDLELPLRAPRLFWKNARHFLRNRRHIRGVFEDASRHHIQIATAEYPLFGSFFQGLLNQLGLGWRTNSIVSSFRILRDSCHALQSLRSETFQDGVRSLLYQHVIPIPTDGLGLDNLCPTILPGLLELLLVFGLTGNRKDVE